MPEEFQDAAGGDGLDFRPLASQAAQRKPAPQSRAAASDGIDFQPVSTAPRPRQSAPQTSADEIDFRPAEKPITFESLYKTPQTGPSLTERAAHVGEPPPAVRALAPDSADLTRVPRSPFTNQLEFTPAIATEEETRREGTIGPRPRGGAAHGTPYEGAADIGERMIRAFGAGAPEGSTMANLTGQRGTKDNPRLLAPEELMTESEQLRHPILTGAGQFAGGFTSPEGLTLLGLTAGAGELAGPGAQTVKRLLAAGFSGSMLYGAAQKVPAISQAIRSGDSYNAQRLLTQLVLETGTAGLAARGSFEETAPTTVPKGTVSAKLMMDEATTRGARRMSEFEANQAARRGMGNLAEAERDVEADRQARINAPVQVPKTYQGEPTILRGRPQGPERNPLEVEAQRVREARAENERPAYTVRDLRRVVPEDPSQPPYYVLGGAPEATPQSAGVERPGAGDLVGARGRSKTVSEIASRVLGEQDNSLLRRFGPDVLDEARQEVQAAAGLAGSFERPGRYFAAYGDQNEYMPSRSTNAAKGIHAGGTWYGVGSARGDIEGMHPWFADVAEGPETFAKIAQQGKGAAYDRILERAATHIQNERESARPVIEEFTPQLRSLAAQVRDTDPELAQTMLDLAGGKAVGFQNLRAYIQGKIDDAETAAAFSRAVDEAAAEARESAGAEEAAEPGGSARETEGASARELDFQPLPEPQPINPREVEDMSRALGRRITAEELPGIRRRIEAERNVEAGLRGERRDVAGEIREEHRTKLERGEILPGMETAVQEQREAAGREQGRQLTEQVNRPPESIEARAGTMERESPLFRGTEASPQREIFNEVALKAAKEPAPGDAEYEALKNRITQLEAHKQIPSEKELVANAASLRKSADSLTAQIEAKRNPGVSNQNPTARRARIAEGMWRDAERLQRIQDTLHGMADAIENEELPRELGNVRSRALVESLLDRKELPRPYLHNSYIRDLIDKTAGYPNTAQDRALISRLSRGENGAHLQTREQIEAAERLMDVADKRGVNTKFMRDSLGEGKRAMNAGFDTPEKWAVAREKILQYQGEEKAPGPEQQIKKAERELIGIKIPGYFPTPRPVATNLVERADIRPGMSVLEPSAGKGNIADAVRGAVPDARLDTVEPQTRLRDILELKNHNLVGRDFLEHQGKYDRIVMNPPFEGGQDIEHVQHAYELLKPGGKLVAVMSEGPFFRNDSKATAFRAWLDSVDGTSEKMEPRSFTGKEAERQTGAASRIVEIEKPQGRVQAEHLEAGEGKGPQGELYSGLHPRALVEGARVLQRAWDEKVARPLIDKVLTIGDKYVKAREADPAVAEGLHLLDNAPQYLRSKAAQEVHNIIGNLSRAQERLFTLLADADSRENLRANHPDEFRQAMNDGAIQEALRKYRPIEQELTRLRGQMGGEVLDQDYLRRIYDKHVAGVNKPDAPSSSGERATSAYDRVIRPQRIGNLSREATAEYHYEHGLHEFGPAFATKYIGTHLRALRDQVAHEFIDNATMLPAGASEPRFIMYNGERYYRPDLAREMRDAGQKNVKAYDRYDSTAGEKFPVPADGKYLGPRELVKTLNDFGRREESEPGAIRRFFQEQILGFGFGVPHIANIMRRVSQSVPGGAANPKGWVESWRVVLSKELRERGISGLNDPTFDMLAKHGAISTGEMANLKEYWGGNLNPANWARSLAKIGHEVLFNPEAAKGFGGIDQRARLYIADLVRSQRPELTDAQVAAAVRTQLGDYNRANWTDRQKMLGKFMMFPGWDFSSVKWVLQHPIKTTAPPALVVLLANQVLNQLGQNRSEYKYDISTVHVGDRSYGTSLLRESVARNLFRPAIGYAQAKLRGESNARAMDEAARGATAGAGGLLSMMRPDLSGFVALATNRQGLFTGKEIVGRQDYDTPGRILPSRAIEKQAVFAVRKAIPALDRLLDSGEETDWRSFAGGNLGVPNYRDDAEKRLIRNAGEADRIHQVITRLAKTDPKEAREYVKDPDNAAFALFHHDLQQMESTLRRMDQAKEAIQNSGLRDADKQKRLETIEHSRRNLLQHADWLNNLLFERREKGKPSNQLFAPGFLSRALRSTSQTGAQR